MSSKKKEQPNNKKNLGSLLFKNRMKRKNFDPDRASGRESFFFDTDSNNRTLCLNAFSKEEKIE